MTAKEKNEAMWAYLFVAPTILGLIILNYYPAVDTVIQSFCKTGDFGKGNVFVGLANYQRAFADPEIWQSLLNTIKYAIIEVPFGVVIALILAVFLNNKLKGTSFFRTVFFLPMVCAPAAVAMVWKWLYNQQFGLLNNIFHTNVAWISDPKIAWISIGVIGVWSIIGYNMVLFIIMMPLTRSSMVSLGIFTALFAFKDLMWPMIVCTSVQTTTLAAGLAKAQGQYGSNYPQMMAAAVLAVVPMIVIYVIFQKQFVEGIATSGGKL